MYKLALTRTITLHSGYRSKRRHERARTQTAVRCTTLWPSHEITAWTNACQADLKYGHKTGDTLETDRKRERWKKQPHKHTRCGRLLWLFTWLCLFTFVLFKVKIIPIFVLCKRWHLKMQNEFFDKHFVFLVDLPVQFRGCFTFKRGYNVMFYISSTN